MSKLSYQYTELLQRLRFVDEFGPLSAVELLTDYRELFEAGFIDSFGRLTADGKQRLGEAEDRGP